MQGACRKAASCQCHHHRPECAARPASSFFACPKQSVSSYLCLFIHPEVSCAAILQGLVHQRTFALHSVIL